MKSLILALPLVAMTVFACGQAQTQTAKAPEPTFTNQTSPSTSVTVHPTATSIARLDEPSVTRTTSSQLVVRTPADETHRTMTAGKPLDPKIHKHLAKDPALRDVHLDDIQYVNVDGHVTLGGTVRTLADKVEVEQRVREASSAKQVDNDIRIWK